MQRYTAHIQPRQIAEPRIDRRGIANRDAKLVLGFARRNLRVGARIDIRIDAQDAIGADGACGGNGRKLDAFFFGLDIELPDCAVEPLRHFSLRLADPREDNPVRRHPSRQCPLEFAARHNIGAHARVRQDAEHREVGIGLHGKCHISAPRRFYGILKHPCMPLERGTRIDIDRCADFGSDPAQRHVLGVEGAVLVVKMVHLNSVYLAPLQPLLKGLGVAPFPIWQQEVPPPAPPRRRGGEKELQSVGGKSNLSSRRFSDLSSSSSLRCGRA